MTEFFKKNKLLIQIVLAITFGIIIPLFYADLPKLPELAGRGVPVYPGPKLHVFGKIAADDPAVSF